MAAELRQKGTQTRENGMAIWPYLTNTLVEELGWRMAYVALALISAAICFAIVWLLFRDAGTGTTMRVLRRPAGSSEARAATVPEPGTKVRDQMASRRFYMLASASIVFSIASSALTNIMVPVLIGEGLNPGSPLPLPDCLTASTATRSLL
jgi:hypothetical protein